MSNQILLTENVTAIAFFARMRRVLRTWDAKTDVVFVELHSEFQTARIRVDEARNFIVDEQAFRAIKRAAMLDEDGVHVTIQPGGIVRG